MSGKEKTVCIIGAILFCLVVHDPVVTLLLAAAGLTPQILKVLELGGKANNGEYRDYQD